MASERYSDILHLKHPEPQGRARMSRSSRAAQFAPFAALTGYDAVIEESARYTKERRELSEESMAELNEKLLCLAERIHEQPEILLTYFKPDSKKQGGAYIECRGRLKKIDSHERCLVLTDKRSIPIDDIYKIESPSN